MNGCGTARRSSRQVEVKSAAAMRGTRLTEEVAQNPEWVEARWVLVRNTVARTCCVCAPSRVRLPPETLRFTTAGRSACSARQLVASTYYCQLVTELLVPSPAATVVVLRDGATGLEVFMVRRHEGSSFMGGAHVFPGGRVDPADRDSADEQWCDGINAAARRLDDLAPADAVAFHVAAARELFEEAGVLLARDSTGPFVSLAGDEVHERFKASRADVHSALRSLRQIIEQEHLRLALDALVPFAHWITPPEESRRFDTRFFLTRAPANQTPAHDETETTESAWISPSAAIALCRREEIRLPIPTWTTLRELEPFTSVDDALEWARRRRIVARESRLLQHDGQAMYVIPGDPLEPEPWHEEVPQETRFVFEKGGWRARRVDD